MIIRIGKKQVLVSLGILSLILFSIFLDQSSSKLEVDFLDVGQGDATLIKISSGPIILIDGGPDNSIIKRLGENMSNQKRQIDLIIISHFHDDHITGLIEVLKRYEVKKIIYQADSPSSKIWEIFLSTVKNKSIPLVTLDEAMQIKFTEDCFLNLLNPESLSIPEDDNNSLLTKLDCDGIKILFTGDNNYKVEKALLDSDWDLSADILKISHHGSKTANSEVFLQQVNPQKAVISVGADNRFNHPSPEIIDRFNNLEIMIYRTDQQGDIHILGQY